MYTALIIINSPNTSMYTSKCEHLEHLWRTKKPTVKESRTFHSLDNEQLAVQPPPRVCLVCHVQATAGHGRHDRFVLQLLLQGLLYRQFLFTIGITFVNTIMQTFLVYTKVVASGFCSFIYSPLTKLFLACSTLVWILKTVKLALTFLCIRVHSGKTPNGIFQYCTIQTISGQ